MFGWRKMLSRKASIICYTAGVCVDTITHEMNPTNLAQEPYSVEGNAVAQLLLDSGRFRRTRLSPGQSNHSKNSFQKAGSNCKQRQLRLSSEFIIASIGDAPNRHAYTIFAFYCQTNVSVTPLVFQHPPGGPALAPP